MTPVHHLASRMTVEHLARLAGRSQWPLLIVAITLAVIALGVHHSRLFGFASAACLLLSLAALFIAELPRKAPDPEVTP